MTRWTLILYWVDGDVEDADEVSIVAATAAQAEESARSSWALTNGAQWPSCSVVDVQVFPSA